MKHIAILFLSIFFFQSVSHAQSAKALIASVNKKFAGVQDYKANVYLKFALPGIRLKDIHGRVYYKKPNKLRIRAKGIFFIPRDNPMKDIPKLLADTKAYTSVISGYEVVEGKKCAVVNIIPLDPNLELIVGKFWISIKEPLIYLSEITTKDNGTIRTKNFFGKHAKQALPDKILIQIEMKKFKVPKLLAMDVKKKKKKAEKATRNTGEIYLIMTDYKINTKLSNKVFEGK